MMQEKIENETRTKFYRIAEIKRKNTLSKRKHSR